MDTPKIQRPGADSTDALVDSNKGSSPESLHRPEPREWRLSRARTSSPCLDHPHRAGHRPSDDGLEHNLSGPTSEDPPAPAQRPGQSLPPSPYRRPGPGTGSRYQIACRPLKFRIPVNDQETLIKSHILHVMTHNEGNQSIPIALHFKHIVGARLH